MFASTEGHSCFEEGKTTAPVRADVGRAGGTGLFMLLLPVVMHGYFHGFAYFGARFSLTCSAVLALPTLTTLVITKVDVKHKE